MQDRPVSAIVKDVLRVVLPLGCSVWLVVWLLGKVDFHQVMAVVRHNMTLWPVIAMLVFNFLSYIIRATRWGIQLRGVGIHAPWSELWVSIFGAYALSLLINGLGEAWRCLLVSHRQKASLSTVVGTDIGDRMSDLAMIIIITFITILVASAPLESFCHRYDLAAKAYSVITNYWLWAAIAFVVTAWVIVSRLFRGNKIVSQVNASMLKIWQGFAILFRMKQKGRYIWLTIAIWVCYFMQTYICFLAFPFTKPLLGAGYAYGLLPGLVVLLFSSYSMGIPSSGGLGPWNIAVMFALGLYGISNVDGTAFALIIWTGQALLQVCLGLVTLAWLYFNKSATPAPSK